MSTKDITDAQCVRAALEYHSGKRDLMGMTGLDLLAMDTGQHPKVCMRAYERAERRGYLDYGVSLRTAWATEKGKELLP